MSMALRLVKFTLDSCLFKLKKTKHKECLLVALHSTDKTLRPKGIKSLAQCPTAILSKLELTIYQFSLVLFSLTWICLNQTEWRYFIKSLIMVFLQESDLLTYIKYSFTMNNF